MKEAHSLHAVPPDRTAAPTKQLDRKHTEEKLRQLSRAVEQSQASIIITDAEGYIEYVNPRFEQITGYSAAEVRGKKPGLLKSGEQNEVFYKNLWAVLAAGEEWRGEFHNRKKNGELYWEDASISPVRDENQQVTHYIAVKEDVTQRKQAEAQILLSKSALEKTNRQLQIALVRAKEFAIQAESANRAKSAFLANMSHELRTPLNVIIGVASTLGEETSKDDLAHASALILESGQSLLGIIEEILDYSGLQAGRSCLDIKPFALLSVINHCLRSASEAAKRKHIEVSYWIAPAVPAMLLGDPRRIQQVILNLLTNAVKYTRRGRVHLSITAKPVHAGEWKLSMSVFDTGVGMSPSGLTQLFRPFSRLAQAGEYVTPGTGLGLVISRSFAQLMGGDIAVRSRQGQGSAFRCTVSVSAVDAHRAICAEIAPSVLSGRRVLIVDGDRRRRRLLTAAVTAWGMCAVAKRCTLITDTDVRENAVELGIFSPGNVDCAFRTPFPHVWLSQPNAAPKPLSAIVRAVSPSPLDLGELARTLMALVAGSSEGNVVSGQNTPRNAPLGEQLPLRILAADDIRTNREMLRRMMQHLGYNLDLVENGLEALHAMQQRAYDVVLLDVQMPVMGGLTTARNVLQLFPDSALRPKLVALTANALSGDREKCLDAGMDDYLSKPILPKDLEACFRRLFTPATTEHGPHHCETPPSPKLPLVDRDYLESAVAGLPFTEAKEMLHALHATVTDDFKQLRLQVIYACAASDQPALAEHAHGLKGCFATLGWSRLAGHCSIVVELARAGEFRGMNALPKELDELFAASTAAMDRYFESLDAEIRPSQFAENSTGTTAGAGATPAEATL